MHGDEDEITLKIDTIHEMKEVKEDDHVKNDGMYQVDENGQILLLCDAT